MNVIIILIVVMVSGIYTYVIIYWVVSLNYVQANVCQLGLNKAIESKR